MAIELVEKFAPYVDEVFSQESKKALLTNDDFEFNGAHTVKVWKVQTVSMGDYDRSGAGSVKTVDGKKMYASRYGDIQSLENETEEFTLRKDRSFTFAVDKLDENEAGDSLNAAKALARQQREVIVPEVDTYVYAQMCTNAGITPDPVELTAENIYDKILDATEALDNALVPETGRCLVVAPWVYKLMKQNSLITAETAVKEELRLHGVIANLDGMDVIKVPATRLPEAFGFMVAHPVATVAPVKLESYRTHEDPPGINGHLVEGRIVYDAFVLENKANAIYYQEATNNASDTPADGA